MGVAEQVVHVAQNFLVGAGHEKAHQQRLIRIMFRQGQGGFDALAIHILVDAAIGIAGNVLDDRPPVQGPVQAVDRHHQEDLVDAPHVWQGLEQGEVTNSFSASFSLSSSMISRCARLALSSWPRSRRQQLVYRVSAWARSCSDSRPWANWACTSVMACSTSW